MPFSDYFFGRNMLEIGEHNHQNFFHPFVPSSTQSGSTKFLVMCMKLYMPLCWSVSQLVDQSVNQSISPLVHPLVGPSVADYKAHVHYGNWPFWAAAPTGDEVL